MPGQPGTRGSAPSPSRELPATPPRAAAGRTCATGAPTRPCHRPPDSETATSAARPRLALPRRSAPGRLTPGLASQVPGAQGASSAAARSAVAREARGLREAGGVSPPPFPGSRAPPLRAARARGPAGSWPGRCGSLRAAPSAQPPGLRPRPAGFGADGRGWGRAGKWAGKENTGACSAARVSARTPPGRRGSGAGVGWAGCGAPVGYSHTGLQPRAARQVLCVLVFSVTRLPGEERPQPGAQGRALRRAGNDRFLGQGPTPAAGSLQKQGNANKVTSAALNSRGLALRWP